MAARAESMRIPTVGILCIDIAQKLSRIYPDRDRSYSYIAASYVKHLEAAGAFVVPIWEGKEEHKIPHIGVMCIDMAQSLEKHLGAGFGHSYLPVSYVKQLESLGAVVIPIWIGRERGYYEAILNRVNGVLLPGGAVCLDEAEALQFPKLSNDCVQSARHIYELVMERNAAGVYMPMYGTCLGFQLILINAANEKAVRTKCVEPKFKALPLHLSKDYDKSRLFKDVPVELAKAMCCQPFACHQHTFCITVSSLHRFQLHRQWQVLATQSDGEETFITLIEHCEFPIFGSQFHPEHAAHEQLFACEDTCREAHSSVCIELARHFARTFVDACRRNGNSFDSVQSMARHLISNWQPVFTGKSPDSHWLQCYIFDRHVDYPPE
ncbi:hypothetical protein ACLKA7_017560 [Drosophila subpalustris]